MKDGKHQSALAKSFARNFNEQRVLHRDVAKLELRLRKLRGQIENSREEEIRLKEKTFIIDIEVKDIGNKMTIVVYFGENGRKITQRVLRQSNAVEFELTSQAAQEVRDLLQKRTNEQKSLALREQLEEELLRLVFKTFKPLSRIRACFWQKFWITQCDSDSCSSVNRYIELR